ncbi:hypothetical protein [Embleya sp. NBC_00896]|uniref:hypothetical protein n=1 Tax=Embleya sp. NBC_00896 TaxID=2975961 RepID=UPI002F909C2B|nr:hypothetical protein OG928_48510 [Embleya sp. NBC_00896]
MKTPDENTTPCEDGTPTREPAKSRTGTSARALWRRVRTEDDGYSTETIIVTATLLAIAIAVLLILRNKIVAKANSINFGMDTVEAATHTAVSATHTFVAHAFAAFL